MFKKLGSALSDKFHRKDDLSRQLEIVRIFDLYRAELKKILPDEEGVELVSLKNKTLLIQLSNSVLAGELRLREYEIMQKINEQFGKEVLRKVIYRF